MSETGPSFALNEDQLHLVAVLFKQSDVFRHPCRRIDSGFAGPNAGHLCSVYVDAIHMQQQSCKQKGASEKASHLDNGSSNEIHRSFIRRRFNLLRRINLVHD